MQNRWICFVKGFLKVKIQGDYLERFFNMCRTHDIYLWNINREDDVCICCLYASDFFSAFPLLKKTNTKIKILKKCGMPFQLRIMRKRIVFIIGLTMCLVMLNFMTNYIWAIEYVGEQQISEDELTDFLKAQNIHYGIKKSDINCEENEKKLRAAFPNITWTSIYFEGTKLFVEIKENEKSAPQINEMRGSDIVATEDGIVDSIITRNGVPLVKKGDVVEKGQILVEGSVPVYDEAKNIIDYQIYDADADILVSTTIEYSDKINPSYPVMFYTGNNSDSNYLDIFGYHIEEVSLEDVFFNSKNKAYETITSKKQIVLLDNIYLPLYYGRISRKEYYLQYLEYTSEETEVKLNENLQKFILSLEEKGVQIVEKNVKIVQNREYIEMKGKIAVIKPTGKRIDIIPKEIKITSESADESEE